MYHETWYTGYTGCIMKHDAQNTGYTGYNKYMIHRIHGVQVQNNSKQW